MEEVTRGWRTLPFHYEPTGYKKSQQNLPTIAYVINPELGDTRRILYLTSIIRIIYKASY